MSNRRIFDIQKDSIGYMWFLTNEGIDRYNGKDIKHYKLIEENKESSSPIHLGWLYFEEKGKLWVAYKGKKPDGRTPLYLAPFFNVTGGSVCLGNSTLEKPESLDFHTLLEYWEKRFWLSEFSHLGGGKNPTRNNLVLVTERMREQPFDNDELQPINKRLKDILP